MIHPYDRQTDKRMIAYTRYRIYAVARKKKLEALFFQMSVTATLALVQGR